jgi:hypothetical protein
MKAIINSLNEVIYKYEGEGQYPSCLAEKSYMKMDIDTEYKHIDIPDEILKKYWFRMKWDPELEIFIDDPFLIPSTV